LAWATKTLEEGLKTTLPPVWSRWWWVLIVASIVRPLIPGRPWRQRRAVSGNWVSTTTRASLEAR
jgi:hypothetical protein